MADADLLGFLGSAGRSTRSAWSLPPPSSTAAALVRMPKAYPVCDDDYQAHLEVIRRWLKTLSNLELAGRNGMRKY